MDGNESLSAVQGEGNISTRPSPARLNDRVLSRLGEHQLLIREQEGTLQQMDGRLKLVEEGSDENAAALKGLMELNISASLRELREGVKSLESQMKFQQNEYKKGYTRMEDRIHQAEMKQDDLATQVLGMEELIDELQREQEELSAHIMKEARDMMYQIVDKIAEQFDSVDSVVKRQAEEQMQLIGRLDLLGETCAAMEARVEVAKDEMAKALESSTDKSTSILMSRTDEVMDCMRDTKVSIVADVQDIKGMVQEHQKVLEKGLNPRMTLAEAAIKDICDTWTQKSDHLQLKFDSYKGYVAKLRHDVHSLHNDVRGAGENLVQCVSKELKLTERTMCDITRELEKNLNASDAL